MGCISKYVSNNPCVYLISVGNYLKIGKSFGDAKQRADQFAQSCPLPVSVLATIPGDKRLERDLHRRFAPYRVRQNPSKGGEWYFYAPDILEVFGVRTEPI